jgi:ABC-2 type transport system ATP-binding protein
MAEFISRSAGQAIRVRTPTTDALARAVTASGGTAAGAGDGHPGELEVSGLTEERIGDIAFAHGVRLHHLAVSRASLEQAFMELTADSVEYHAGLAASGQPAHTGMGA